MSTMVEHQKKLATVGFFRQFHNISKREKFQRLHTLKLSKSLHFARLPLFVFWHLDKMTRANDGRGCDNCKRIGFDISINVHVGQNVKKKHGKKYFCVDRDSMIVGLCSSCEEYLLGNKRVPQVSDYWPAMVYKFLSHQSASNLKPVPN